MANEEVEVTFYDVNACGFHRRGSDDAEFGGLDEALTNLREWSRGMRLGETVQTYAQSEDEHNVYLFDLKKQGGNWLLALWNRVPSTDGKIPSVDERGAVGSARVHDNRVTDGTIPGFGTYYWFVPSRNLMATIRIQHPLTKSVAAKEYLKGFLEKHSQWAFTPEEGGTTEFRESEESAPRPVRPKVKFNIKRRGSDRQFLLDNAHNVRKIERKTRLNINLTVERNLIGRFLQAIGQRNRGDGQAYRKFHFALETTVTRDEMNALINDWERDEMGSGYADVGFVMKGENKLHWLGDGLVREKPTLDFDLGQGAVPQADALLRELNDNSHTLLP
ncbi:hypothetical protein GM160_05630 [Guyparkeria halophila]|uniref:Uncharacterized protein n=1 Tax=Guyparkeria halophila TaxID=47960 RepID=A0A6I6CWC3_9GAMM|nr:hypothetical protein [Guyparkeria halophila]QGT78419.1 hypothetical protein GM160_05630 [Guyparkeria halophila]